jgi:fructosamine-3-kinase
VDHAIIHSVEQAFGLKVSESQRVFGGDINASALLRLENGKRYFIKWNRQAPDHMFETEFKGLRLLNDAEHQLHVPEPIKWDAEWLVMELLQEGRSSTQSAEHFGRELAALHKNTADTFGLEHDNFIGRLPQSNKRHRKWADFYLQERLLPLANRLHKKGQLSIQQLNQIEGLHSVIEDLYPNEAPALLHGDLWSGNYFYLNDGKAAIYDPAVYYGHREMDLAMSRLFGGFSPDFYRAYDEAYPIAEGFDDRLQLSQLYPVLVHACLFGGHYIQGSINILKQYG